MALKKKVKKLEGKERKEYNYLLREFFEIKRLFVAVKHAKDALIAKKPQEVIRSLHKIKTFLRKSGRVERRMARAYSQVEKLLLEVDLLLEKKDKNIADKIRKTLEKIKVFNADLEKLDSNGGEISKILNQVEDISKKIEKGKVEFNQAVQIDLVKKVQQALNLIDESLTDITAFENLIDDLIHIDVFIYKNARLYDYNAFSKELKKMVMADQASRSPFLEKLWLGFFKGGMGGIHKNVSSIDEYNTSRLKILLDHFPVYTVKEEDLNNVWLLAQHADKDLKFQQWIVYELKKHPNKEKVGRFIAALTDRILYLHENKPQRYGTFYTPHKGIFAFDPIEGGKLQTQKSMEISGATYIYGELSPKSLQIINAKRETLYLDSLQEKIKKSKYFKDKERILMWLTKPPSF